MKQTKGLLFFGCFLLVAGLAFVLVFTLRGGLGSGEYNCDLVEEEPQWQNGTHLGNQVDQDDTMIARFAGYIKFIHFDETVKKMFYLPLELIDIKYTSFNDYKLVVLKTTCASLEFLVHKTDNGTTVKQLLAFWRKPYRSYDHCYVHTQKLDSSRGTHYACHKQQFYDCFQTTDIDVWDQIELVANELEFEINGNASSLRKGRFSTAATECAN